MPTFKENKSPAMYKKSSGFKMKSPLKGVKIKPKETKIEFDRKEKASRKPGESRYQADVRRKREGGTRYGY